MGVDKPVTVRARARMEARARVGSGRGWGRGEGGDGGEAGMRALLGRRHTCRRRAARVRRRVEHSAAHRSPNLSKVRVERVSSRPAWALLVRGSSPVWHTGRDEGLAVVDTRVVVRPHAAGSWSRDGSRGGTRHVRQGGSIRSNGSSNGSSGSNSMDGLRTGGFCGGGGYGLPTGDVLSEGLGLVDRLLLALRVVSVVCSRRRIPCRLAASKSLSN